MRNIEDSLIKSGKDTYIAPLGSEMIFFIDDLNLSSL